MPRQAAVKRPAKTKAGLVTLPEPPLPDSDAPEPPPDPGTHVYILFGADGKVVVLPDLNTPPPFPPEHAWAVPRDSFPEFVPKHGLVWVPGFTFDIGADKDVAGIRAAYAAVIANEG